MEAVEREGQQQEELQALGESVRLLSQVRAGPAIRIRSRAFLYDPGREGGGSIAGWGEKMPLRLLGPVVHPASEPLLLHEFFEFHLQIPR